MPTLGDLIDPEREQALRALVGQTKADSPPDPEPDTVAVPVEVPAKETVEVEVDADVAEAEHLETDEADGLAELVDFETPVEEKRSRASLDRSPKKNWVENTGDLPGYIREIARAIHQDTGKPLSQAIPIAIGRVKRWAAGGDNVKADTRAKAAAAVAAWEALKAKNKARMGGKKDAELDIEVKGPETDVDGMEHKSASTATLVDTDDETGVVTALVSATGIRDRVDDIIEPGAYAETLARTEPIGVWSHDDKVWVARAEEVKELPPGDAMLREVKTNDGKPWPAEAGALLVKARFNLETPHGAAAYSDVKFFKGKTGWSIGYRVAPGTRRDPKTGVRRIKSLELYEFSPVMVGAAPQAMTLSVKSLSAAHSVDPEEVPEPAETLPYGEVKALLEARDELAESLELDEKGLRRVRSAAGVRKFGQPMGSVIVDDPDAPKAPKARAAGETMRGEDSVQRDRARAGITRGADGTLRYPKDDDEVMRTSQGNRITRAKARQLIADDSDALPAEDMDKLRKIMEGDKPPTAAKPDKPQTSLERARATAAHRRAAAENESDAAKAAVLQIEADALERFADDLENSETAADEDAATEKAVFSGGRPKGLRGLLSRHDDKIKRLKHAETEAIIAIGAVEAVTIFSHMQHLDETTTTGGAIAAHLAVGAFIALKPKKQSKASGGKLFDQAEELFRSHIEKMVADDDVLDDDAYDEILNDVVGKLTTKQRKDAAVVLETKAGRVLSGANAEKVIAAYNQLGAVLRKAGLIDQGEGPESIELAEEKAAPEPQPEVVDISDLLERTTELKSLLPEPPPFS